MVHSLDVARVVAMVVAGSLTACAGVNDANTSPDGGATAPAQTHDPCNGEGFRGTTLDSVVCPGAPSCLCAFPQICCMQSVDSNKGTCESLGACRLLALNCDGPEDCNATSTSVDAGVDEPDGEVGAHDAAVPPPQVCCLDEAIGSSGGGSSCKAPGTCVGKVLCRSDDDCKSVPAFPHCRPADYGTPGVADRGLDGLVGECMR